MSWFILDALNELIHSMANGYPMKVVATFQSHGFIMMIVKDSRGKGFILQHY